jgi:hypothetical protein
VDVLIVGMIDNLWQREKEMRELSDYELMNTSAEQTGFPIQVATFARACFYSFSSRALLSRSLYRKLATDKWHLMAHNDYHEIKTGSVL